MAEKSFWSYKKDKEWFMNFFFYYGKFIIATLVIIAIITWAAVSCTRKVEYDCEIYYMSDKHFESKVFDGVEKALEDVVDDADGKQGVKVVFNDFTVVPENAATSDIDLIMQSKVHAEIAEGSGYLYVMNEEWKEYCENSGLMEDISKYTGEESPCYSFEITDNKFFNDLGVKDPGNKLYIGIRILNNNRLDDKVEINRNNNAVKVLKYIIENK